MMPSTVCGGQIKLRVTLVGEKKGRRASGENEWKKKVEAHLWHVIRLIISCAIGADVWSHVLVQLDCSLRGSKDLHQGSSEMWRIKDLQSFWTWKAPSPYLSGSFVRFAKFLHYREALKSTGRPQPCKKKNIEGMKPSTGAISPSIRIPLARIYKCTTN